MTWYEELLSDLKKFEFSIIICKWKMGERITRDWKKFNKEHTIKKLAEDLKVSQSHLYHCTKFYEKYPDYNTIINNFQIYSWNYIINNLLFEYKKENNGERQEINEQFQRFISEKLDLWKRGDSKFKEAIEQDAKNKIKLYRLLLNSIKEEKN